MTLTTPQREALAQLPSAVPPSGVADDVIEELLHLGLLEKRAGALRLTQKGAVVKVMMRSLRPIH